MFALLGDCNDFDPECGKSLTREMCSAFEEAMAKRCPKMCNLCGKCKKNQQQQNNYGIKSKQFNTIKSYGKCLLQFNSIVVDPLHSSFHPLLLFFLFLLSFRCPHYLNVRNRLVKILGQSCDFSSRARSVC